MALKDPTITGDQLRRHFALGGSAHDARGGMAMLSSEDGGLPEVDELVVRRDRIRRLVREGLVEEIRDNEWIGWHHAKKSKQGK